MLCFDRLILIFEDDDHHVFDNRQLQIPSDCFI